MCIITDSKKIIENKLKSGGVLVPTANYDLDQLLKSLSSPDHDVFYEGERVYDVVDFCYLMFFNIRPNEKLWKEIKLYRLVVIYNKVKKPCKRCGRDFIAYIHSDGCTDNYCNMCHNTNIYDQIKKDLAKKHETYIKARTVINQKRRKKNANKDQGNKEAV